LGCPFISDEVEFMKVNLVVAQGVHTGKVIPIATPQFLIGRDPQCNLRPASPSVSKQHCGIFIRGGTVIIQDYGSTNGTVINGEPVQGEREISNDDKLKIGPLEFVIRIEKPVGQSTVVASPQAKKGAAAAAVPVEAATAVMSPHIADDDSENAAAMMMMMDDGDTPTSENSVPDGTTVMDIPAMPGDPAAKPTAPPPKPPDSSKAAADLLSKYMRRPRGG